MIDGHALGAVGLSPAEEDAYRLLLAHPELDPPALAAGLGVPLPEADRLLIGLTNRGLAKMVDDESFAATPPESSIVALLGERLDGLRRGYAAVDEMERLYRASRASYGSVPNSETVTGLRAIRSQLSQLNAQARQEVRMFMRHPLISTDAGGSLSDTPADESVRYRTLYEKALLDDAEVLELIRRSSKRGVRVRFAGALPVKLLVVDDRVALIMGPGTQPVALRTEHPALVACAMSLFEQIWSTAVPAAIGDLDVDPQTVSGPSDPDDRLLLSLLLAGLTDQAIAARLGVGLRTVQRRVRDLMDAANVDTRIQLGWQASRKGWVA